MVYNYRYKMEFVGLKEQDPANYYYRLEFYKLDETAVTYDIETLQCADNPFILKYIAEKDFAFCPFRPSSAEINIYFPNEDTVKPNDFFSGTNNFSFKVVFKLIDVVGVTETSLWTGYLLTDDIQYEWQDQYYLRLQATDNLALLKEYKYSRDDVYAMFADQYTEAGISIKDFIVRCLSFIGLDLDIKIGIDFYRDELAKNETSMFIHELSTVDLDTRSPLTVYKCLTSLMESMGLILFQDNRDSTWTILNINDLCTDVNNEVTFRKYDFEGTYIEDVTTDYSAGINTSNDIIWSDVNQIVTLKKRIDEVRMMYDYKRHNLVNNFSFYRNDSGVPTNWTDTGFASATDVSPASPIQYNPNSALITENSAVASPVAYTKYFRQNINGTLYRAFYDHVGLAYEILTDQLQVYFSFDYRIISTDGTTSQPASVRFYRPADGKYLLFGPDGVWYTVAGLNSSGAVIGGALRGNSGQWQNFQAVSKLTVSQGSATPSSTNWFFQVSDIDILFYPTKSSSADTYIDNVVLTFTPEVLRYCDSYGYVATQTSPYWVAVNKKAYDINTLTIKSMYNGGFLGELSCVYFEDCIFTKVDNDFESNVVLSSGNNWFRKWETYVAESNSFLSTCTAKSILSFYRNNGKKYTGNVYAEQTPIATVPFAFPMYVEIDADIDTNKTNQVVNDFIARVTNDGGSAESTYCGSNVITEFYRPNGKYLMVEGAFDYRNNKTLVNLHQDNSDTVELGFSTYLAPISGNGNTKYTTVGSTTNDTQDEVTDG